LIVPSYNVMDSPVGIVPVTASTVHEWALRRVARCTRHRVEAARERPYGTKALVSHGEDKVLAIMRRVVDTALGQRGFGPGWAPTKQAGAAGVSDGNR